MMSFVAKSPSSLLFLLLSLLALLCLRSTVGASCLQPGAQAFPIWLGPNDTRWGPCGLGFYCPNLDVYNSTTWPVICTPTFQCALDRLQLEWCEPQGLYEPTICKAGYYCPPPGNEQIKCPKGYFCPIGSYKPLKCPWISHCPAGSETYRQYATIVVIVCVDLFVAIVCGSYYLNRRRKHRKHFHMLSDTSQEDDVDNGIEEGGTPSPTRILIEGFNLSRGNQPLLDFEFTELGLSIPGGKKILNGVTGTISHSQVTAVMGPSGAGKTTFLATLMGKVESNWKTEGSLLVNGVEAKGLSKLKKFIGYVPQEDVMHRELSVWQNLQYSADIRLPREWNRDQRKRHVNAILDALDLVNVRNSPIGDENQRGVSGGQRKRVNIGMELAACPLALFCDEPTSGLDASSSLSVVKAVKDVARTTGITVVMVIHQPRVEIWNNLDRVLILAPGGITAYLGEQRHAQPYFEQHLGAKFAPLDNPADSIMDLISKNGIEYARIWKETGKDWLDQYISNLSSDEEAKLEKKHKKSKKSKKHHHQNDQQKLQEEKEEEEGEQEQGDQKQGDQDKQDSHKKKKKHKTEHHKHEPKSENNESNIIEMHDVSKKKDFDTDREGSEDKIVRGASFMMQLWLAFLRALKQQYFTLPSLLLEIGLAVVAGALIGFSAKMHYTGVAVAPYTTLTPSPEVTIVPQKSLYISMAVGIAAASAGVKTFGEERVIFWRESSAGHNRLSYYLGVSLAVLPRIALGGLHFASFFQLISAGYTSYGHMVLNCILLFFAVYGLAAVVSMLVPRQDAPLLAAVVAIIASVLNGYVRAMPKAITYISYAYWSNDAYFTGESQFFEHVFDISITAKFFNYVPHRLAMDYGLMFAIGIIYRIIGFFLLAFLHRDKQR